MKRRHIKSDLKHLIAFFTNVFFLNDAMKLGHCGRRNDLKEVIKRLVTIPSNNANNCRSFKSPSNTSLHV